MTLRAYAKINLLLRVLRRRTDGYHDLLSVFQAVSLYDRVMLEPSDEEGIRLTCDDPRLPTDERNLACRAAVMFYGRTGLEPFLRIHLEKHIPLQAGLGGGSCDAAAVLNGLNRLYGAPLEERELHAMAAALGSDVPFFLRGGCAVAVGRGERLTPKLSLPLHAVLVCPNFGVETAWAYRQVRPNEAIPVGLNQLLEKPEWTLEDLQPYLENNLEAPVTEAHPEIRDIERQLTMHGAKAALMTGSGSTVFGLFPDALTARNTAKALSGAYQTYAVTGVDRGYEVEEERVTNATGDSAL